jgi:hypothetical protein
MLKEFAVTVRCEPGYRQVVTADAVAACRLAEQLFQASDDFTPEDSLTALVV